MDRRVALVFSLLLAAPLLASGRKWTDAENMGFAGPVKSVSTTSQKFMREPAQPDGPTIVYPLPCGECGFDREGNLVRSGWTVNGSFSGTVEHRILDAQGRVHEEVRENEKGEATSRNVYIYGPAGKVQGETFINGKLFNSTASTYDDRGGLIESDTYGPDGSLESHHESTFDERGNEIESVDEGPGDIYFDVVKTYSPKNGNLRTFTSLNHDGTTRLLLSMNDDTVLSFWQQPGDKPTYGSGVCFADDNGTERDCRDYNSDGTYVKTHYVFTDKSKRNPLKATRYGADGQPIMEAEYEYELDAFGNWTMRAVWVWTQESGERKLLEKDVRTLTYYAAEYARP
jgi:hypothetical protein